ncbi:MAG: GntR family transcriptional regulator [Candidatus Pseudobacter hemicellulosilyticus]|uniref:GntR family transcriptional regulator n=1 Tax=Candidatus Pseudobacter hemicellulosilyticus TaxID=3121375 RepID=A0AAJ6BFF4_9BACT|nr:MAG: GntR family transcriptional regulator [Pseudobacter sp.]
MDILEIDHQSAMPLHAQVEELLRKIIGMPEYQNGKLLPNEIDIAKQLGVSRSTVRQATNKLVYEQLLVRKKGVGTTVARNNITTKLDKWDSFTHEMDEKGMPFRNYSVKVSMVEPDKDLQQLFRIGPEATVLKMERVKGLDGEPIVHFISYFHPRTGLSIDDDFSRPLYEMLEKEHHIVATVSKEGISAILADKKLGKLLDIEIGAAILFRKRVVCDAGDRPIEFNLGYYRADRFTYSIDIARK